MAPVCSRPLATTRRESSADVSGPQLVATLLCLRLQHQAQERRFQQRHEAAKRRLRGLQQLLMANSFTVTAFAVHSWGTVERSRWRFPRNERWFEDTLPQLGEAHFKKCFRVTPATFRYIVEACRVDLTRQDTEMTEAVSVKKRVAVGLYRLCSTAEERTIAGLFALGRSTVNMIYKEFCEAVLDNLEDEWIATVPPSKMPQHMREFAAVTGFPQGVGALDGCHFAVSPPQEDATDYYNYKGWYSIILLALVDHRYRFRYTNVGSPGRCNDAYVYGRSKLCRFIESEAFQEHTAEIKGTLVPPKILCDRAFPLSQNLQKPFANASVGTPEAAFNYNLSKTRRVVENAFGRLKARFRFVMKRMECDLDTSVLAIKACCVLNNICEDFRDSIDQLWEEAVAMHNAMYTQPARITDCETGNGQEVRAALANYFFKQSG